MVCLKQREDSVLRTQDARASQETLIVTSHPLRNYLDCLRLDLLPLDRLAGAEPIRQNKPWGCCTEGGHVN